MSITSYVVEIVNKSNIDNFKYYQIALVTSVNKFIINNLKKISNCPTNFTKY